MTRRPPNSPPFPTPPLFGSLGGPRPPAPVGSRPQWCPAPIADPAAGPLHDRNRRHEVVGFQFHLDDQVAVTAGEHAVEVTIPAKATQRGARAERLETPPFPGVEGLRRGRVDDGLL